MTTGWREPNQLESEILGQLLQAAFPGAAVLRQQLEGLLVQEIAGEKSLEFKVANQIRVVSNAAIPVGCSYEDDTTDSIRVHILLHVEGGLMRELEFVKDDGTQIIRMPEPSELLISIPGQAS